MQLSKSKSSKLVNGKRPAEIATIRGILPRLKIYPKVSQKLEKLSNFYERNKQLFDLKFHDYLKKFIL